MKIYTKTGDDGTTGLFGGGRVPKDDDRIACYGTVDELNSVLGIARGHNSNPEMGRELHEIQNELFCLGADLATPLHVKSEHIIRIDEKYIRRMEDRIDLYDAKLQPLTNFILPAGTLTAAHLHLARNVCRRAERLAVALSKREPVGEHVMVFLNRLSDFLFVLARYANHTEGREETKWMKP